MFALGPRAGDASTFKIVNNLLAGANLAAGAEALALAHAAGLDLAAACATSSTRARAEAGSSPIASRARSTGDYAPRAAVKLLAKDVGIAAALAERLGVDAPFTQLASRAFAAAVAAGHAEDDDAVLDAPRARRFAARRPSLAARGRARDHHFGRALMSTSTYCQTCPMIGCGT